jgi:hypothetical protein
VLPGNSELSCFGNQGDAGYPVPLASNAAELSRPEPDEKQTCGESATTPDLAPPTSTEVREVHPTRNHHDRPFTHSDLPADPGIVEVIGDQFPGQGRDEQSGCRG